MVTVTTTGTAGGNPGTCSNCSSRSTASGVARSENVSMATGGLCSCWSWGWAEVKVRRPSGSTGWMVELQNRVKNEKSSRPVRLASHLEHSGAGQSHSQPERGEAPGVITDQDQAPWQQTLFPMQLVGEEFAVMDGSATR